MLRSGPGPLHTRLEIWRTERYAPPTSTQWKGGGRGRGIGFNEGTEMLHQEFTWAQQHCPQKSVHRSKMEHLSSLFPSAGLNHSSHVWPLRSAHGFVMSFPWLCLLSSIHQLLFAPPACQGGTRPNKPAPPISVSTECVYVGFLINTREPHFQQSQ